jgi:hypothetical protein
MANIARPAGAEVSRLMQLEAMGLLPFSAVGVEAVNIPED